MNLLVNTLYGMPNIKKAGNLESSLKSNVKIVIPPGIELANVIGGYGRRAAYKYKK